MQSSIHGLRRGDTIQIQYRQWRGAGAAAEIVERWIGGEVIHVEAGLWPVVRLADGQYSDLRPYMTWRLMRRAMDETPPLRAA